MDPKQLKDIGTFYTDTLLNDIVPFWLEHGLDREFGGIMTGLDRDGTVIDSDKGCWQQGRFAWLMGHMYNNIEPRQEWLDAAESTVGFIRKYCFDTDGRLFFHLTRDGQPIRKRRYSFSESFACIAMAELAKATKNQGLADDAVKMFKAYTAYNEKGAEPPKFTDVRPSRGMGVPMIDMVTCHVLRDTIDMPGATEWIDQCIDGIETYFVKDDIECVMETVGPNGELIDTFDGRMLNPGHAIEGAWFIMREAKYRNNDERLVKLGTKMLDYMWKRGWDEEFGGMLYFRDVKGLPCHEYWQDMKFWWPQNETVIATLMAYQLTGDEKYLQWHKLAHDWAFDHFPDKECGEWFGYLHRDGSVSTQLKGNLFKGPFHIPRMLIESARIIGEL